MKAIFKLALFTTLATAFDFAEIGDKVADFVEDHTMTRAEADAVAKKHKFRKLDKHQLGNYNDAHHRMRATRTKLGLPLTFSDPSSPILGAPHVGAGQNGIYVAMLAVAEGLMFQPGYNSCYSSIEGSLLSWDTFSVVLIHVYMPWYWSDLLVVTMDTITLSSGFYSYCDVDKLMTTCTKLVTVEGISELASRAVGAIFF